MAFKYLENIWQVTIEFVLPHYNDTIVLCISHVYRSKFIEALIQNPNHMNLKFLQSLSTLSHDVFCVYGSILQILCHMIFI